MASSWCAACLLVAPCLPGAPTIRNRGGIESDMVTSISWFGRPTNTEAARHRNSSCETAALSPALAHGGVGSRPSPSRISALPQVNAEGQDHHKRDVGEKLAPIPLQFTAGLHGHQRAVREVAPHGDIQ